MIINEIKAFLSKLNNMTIISEKERSPWLMLLIIVACSVVALIIFQFIGLGLVSLFSSDDFFTISNKIVYPFNDPDFKWMILCLQGIVSLGGFVLAPLYYIWNFEKAQFEIYFNSNNLKEIPVLIVFFLVISFMVVNSIFIEWNLNFQFPEFMSGFGTWAKEKEALLEELITYITVFDSLGYFMLAFLIVAVLPGIGEELLFRGLIQNKLQKITGNVHVAIWVSAILFSAFHMQFFGFVPRLLLGAFFGYLYVFSGNLWYAILAHFINNGFTLFMVYLYQNKVTGYDIEQTESIPFITVAVFFVIGSALFYLFYKQVTPTTQNE